MTGRTVVRHYNLYMDTKYKDIRIYASNTVQSGKKTERVKWVNGYDFNCELKKSVTFLNYKLKSFKHELSFWRI